MSVIAWIFLFYFSHLFFGPGSLSFGMWGCVRHHCCSSRAVRAGDSSAGRVCNKILSSPNVRTDCASISASRKPWIAVWDVPMAQNHCSIPSHSIGVLCTIYCKGFKAQSTSSGALWHFCAAVPICHARLCREQRTSHWCELEPKNKHSSVVRLPPTVLPLIWWFRVWSGLERLWHSLRWDWLKGCTFWSLIADRKIKHFLIQLSDLLSARQTVIIRWQFQICFWK